MYKNIQKKIALNLFVGGSIVIVITLSVILLIELNRIDKFAGNLAINELNKHFSEYDNYYHQQTDEALSGLKAAINKSLSHDLFIFIEFLNEQEEKIFVRYLDQFDKNKDIINNKFKEFKMSGKVDYMKTFFNGQLYIKIMVPIHNRNYKKVIGHFEGIYHVSNEELDKIKKRVIFSILQSIIIIIFTTILLYPFILKLNKELIYNSYELLESNINTLKSLGNAIAKRDSETNEHNYRVTIYAIKLAEKMNMNKSQIRSLIKGAFLHDIGKIGISDTILLKPGKLTDDEFEIMKQHVILGVDIIKNDKWLKDAANIVKYHHEKFNGKGYLSGLKDYNIPKNARIFTIVDVFDALVSKRPYKNSFSLEETLKILREGSGSHFDPEYLVEFEQIVDKLYSEISNMQNESQLSNKLDMHILKYFPILS